MLYLYLNGKQAGPYSSAQINEMLIAGTVTPQTPACTDGATEWSTVQAMLALAHTGSVALPPAIAPATKKNGAMLGSVACFVAGIFLVGIPIPFTCFLYGPLLTISLILAIVAIAQGQVGGGVALIFANLLMPPVVGVIAMAIMGGGFSGMMGESMRQFEQQQAEEQRRLEQRQAEDAP